MKILPERGISVTVEDLILAALSKHGYVGPDDNCILQCFELSTLERLRGRTQVKRIFLLKRIAKTNPETLERIKNAEVFSICLDKNLIVPVDNKGQRLSMIAFVDTVFGLLLSLTLLSSSALYCPLCLILYFSKSKAL